MMHAGVRKSHTIYLHGALTADTAVRIYTATTLFFSQGKTDAMNPKAQKLLPYFTA